MPFAIAATIFTVVLSLFLPAWSRDAAAAPTCLTMRASNAELTVCRDTDGQGRARLYLGELRDFSTGAMISLAESPIWQIEAREWKDELAQTTKFPCEVPELPILACPTPILLPPDQPADPAQDHYPADSIPAKLWHDESLVSLSGDSSSALLEWRQLTHSAFPNDALDVQVRIDVVQDRFTFDISATATPVSGNGSNGLLRAVRFPYLVVTSVGSLPDDDHLVVPHAGGWDLDNPYAYGQFGTTAGLEDNDEFPASGMNYPGTMNSQFVGLYDGEGGDDGGSGLGGLLLFAEDPYGNVKRIWGHRARLGSHAAAVKLYVSHYNVAPERSSLEEARSALRSFSLESKLGYRVALAAHAGNWFDALVVYERWARHDPRVLAEGFLREGPLASRTDVPQAYLNGGVLLGVPLTPEDQAPRTVHDDVVDMLDAVDFIAAALPETALGKPIRSQTTFGFVPATSSIWRQECRESHMPAGDWGYLGRSCFRKDEVRAFIGELRELLAGTYTEPLFAQNTDTGNIPAAESQLVARIHERKRLDRRVCVISEILQPSHRGGSIYDLSDNEHFSCNGSRKTRSMRQRTLRQIYRLSRPRHQDGFDLWLLSGQGSVSKPCSAPVSRRVSGAHRKHAILGGTTQIDGFTESIERFSRRQSRRNPRTFFAFEREHEYLIPVGIPGGHGSQYPYYDPITRTPKAVGGDPIPLAALAFHDYKLHGTEINFRQGVFAWHADAVNGGLTDRYKTDWNYPYLRLWMAQTLIWGRTLSYNVAPTCWTGAGGDAICPDGYGSPSNIDPSRRGRLWDWQFLRQLVRARRIFSDYLAYGRALKLPRVSGGSDFFARIPFDPSPLRPDMSTWRDIPKVWASAWQAPDGSIGIIAVNFWIAEPNAPEPSNRTGQASSVVLTFTPSDWGLDAGPYTLERFDHATLQWVPVTSFPGGASPYSTPPRDVPPVVDPSTWAPTQPIKDLPDNEDAIVALRIVP